MNFTDTHSSVTWMKARPTQHTEFFDSLICHCTKFRYFDWPDLDDTMSKMPCPPSCRDCGRLFDYTKMCQRCGVEYYHWFHHPRDIPLQWWCWNCTDEFSRQTNAHRPGLVIARPHPATLPPGFVFFEYKIKNPEMLMTASRNFREFLKGL